MKSIVIGDLHIKLSNCLTIKKLLDFTLEMIAKHSVSDCILLGDVLHTHEKLLTPCLNLAHTFVTQISEIIPVFVLVGNHDYVCNSEFLTTNHWMNTLKTIPNVTVVDNVIEDSGRIFCPYTYPGRLDEALGNKKNKILFCHQEFIGCNMGAIISTHGDPLFESPSPIKYVISGHIHDTQTLTNGYSTVYYPGAPLQNTFNESSDRQICIVEYIDSGIPKITNIDITEISGVSAKRVIQLKEPTDPTKVEQLMKQVQKTTAEIPNAQIKVKITCSKDAFTSFKTKKEYNNLVKSGVVFQRIEPDTESVVDQSSNLVPNDSKRVEFYDVFKRLAEKNGLLEHFTELIHNELQIK
jgi:DNA repair exonuclease SbcCD nuclease subunit